MICDAKDLSPDQKATIEMLLGRSVHEGEAVSVRAFEPVAVSHQRKREIAGELRKYLPHNSTRSRARERLAKTPDNGRHNPRESLNSPSTN